ncbi:hypothetical protein Tco_0247199 [Tanacetum coccineum]
MNSSDPSPSYRPTKVKVPKELPKVSMVNTSLKKLKHHLAGFEMVVKERTTAHYHPLGLVGVWYHINKLVFRDEIIPFVKALKDIFNAFDQYLIDELIEIQNVFHQMEQAVEQHRLESKTFEVKMNKVLNENERLLDQVISKDIVNIIVNSFMDNAYVNVHECEKCLKLKKASQQKRIVEKEIYDKLFRSYTTLEKHCISLEVDTQLNQENFQKRNSVQIKVAPKSIKSLWKSLIYASLQEKVMVITALKNELRKLKGKYLAHNMVTKNTIDPKMLKIDVEPMAPRLLNNRTAHSDYLRHTQEQVVILREIVEQGKLQNPLNNSLDSACKYTKSIQELLIIIRQTCPSINNSSDKLVVVTPKNKDKRVRFTEPVTSSGNTNTKTTSSSNLVFNKPMLSSTRVKPSTSASRSQLSGNTKKDKIRQTPSSGNMCQNSKLNEISEILCVKCNGCMLSDNHDLCVLDFINDVNARAKSKYVKKSSKRKVWNQQKMPLRKPIALETDTPKLVVTLVYSRKPKKSKTNVPVVQIVLWYLDSGCSKHMTRHRSQLTNFVNKFLGTVKFGNDHVAKILGNGDYQIGNVTISRVYYYINPPSSVDRPTPEVIAPIAEVVAPEPVASTGSPSSTTVDQDTPSPSNSQTSPKNLSSPVNFLTIVFFGSLFSTVVHNVLLTQELVTNIDQGSALDNILVKLKGPVKLDEMGGILINKARLVARVFLSEEACILRNLCSVARLDVIRVPRICSARGYLHVENHQNWDEDPLRKSRWTLHLIMEWLTPLMYLSASSPGPYIVGNSSIQRIFYCSISLVDVDQSGVLRYRQVHLKPCLAVVAHSPLDEDHRLLTTVLDSIKFECNMMADEAEEYVVVCKKSLGRKKGSKSENKGKVPTEDRVVLRNKTQQGTSYEVSVSAEGVEELKRKVKIKGEKKEALLTLRQKPAGNPVKEILLKLNLPDHRSILTDSKIKVKLKNLKKDAILKLFKITYQERYEHVGPEVTRSQEGKDYKMETRDYAWLMILRSSKDHIQVKNKIQAKA